MTEARETWEGLAGPGALFVCITGKSRVYQVGGLLQDRLAGGIIRRAVLIVMEVVVVVVVIVCESVRVTDRKGKVTPSSCAQTYYLQGGDSAFRAQF